MLKKYVLVASLISCTLVAAQKKDQKIIYEIDSKSAQYGEIAHQIWQWAEMGYLEEKSAALLQETLKQEGFTIEKGVAGIPTAFIAE